MNENSVIVSRHPAAIQFLLQQANLPPTTPVIGSATVEDVRGKVVYGNIPYHLGCEAEMVVAIEFTGTPPRGTEYTIEQMIESGAVLRRYKVQRYNDLEREQK